MSDTQSCDSGTVICRIGSLERNGVDAVRTELVICRIGSLEIYRKRTERYKWVICRIGSLEKDRQGYLPTLTGYLPYRQLRNSSEIEKSFMISYLPYR